MAEERSLPGSVRARLGSIVADAEELAKDKRKIKDLVEEKASKKPRPSRPKTQEESFRDLDAFREEADAGMPDESLARAANVSITVVLIWRKARGIKRKKGYLRRREIEMYAVDSFGDGYTSEIQGISSELKGLWELPEYVLRLPLKYDELTRQLYFLHTELGSTVDLLASAFGLRPRDVEMAIAVEVAHLERVSAPCVICQRPCDPAYGKACSARCRSQVK